MVMGGDGGSEYVQNTLYDSLKELINIILEKECLPPENAVERHAVYCAGAWRHGD